VPLVYLLCNFSESPTQWFRAQRKYRQTNCRNSLDDRPTSEGEKTQARGMKESRQLWRICNRFRLLVRPNLATEQRTIHVAAVVGSIIFLTSVIFVAGKPLISACFRMMASSLAR
jgi:hypothetical protein